MCRISCARVPVLVTREMAGWVQVCACKTMALSGPTEMANALGWVSEGKGSVPPECHGASLEVNPLFAVEYCGHMIVISSNLLKSNTPH